jgi:hypothetical protein
MKDNDQEPAEGQEVDDVEEEEATEEESDVIHVEWAGFI